MGMTRARALPPDLFTEEKLIALPLEVRWTAIGLRVRADDYGRGSANASLVKADIWPLNRDITEQAIEDHLLELDEAGYIVLYADGARSCYAMAEWAAVSHPIPSRLPPPPPESLSRRSRAALERLSAGERAGWESEREERSDWSPSGVSLPPSPFCKLHPVGTTEDCRHCGTARLRAKEWERQQRSAAQEGEAE